MSEICVVVDPTVWQIALSVFGALGTIWGAFQEYRHNKNRGKILSWRNEANNT